MVFSSITFLLFFTFVLLVHYLPLSWKIKKINLLLASYLFYAAWNPPFVVLIWISTLIDWLVANRIPRAQSSAARKALLLISLLVNLGLLGFFKYGSFLLDNFIVAARMLGMEFHPPSSDIVLPVGISFYTFQTLSYTIDVYRGRMKPWNSFLDFALFVTFFPQLVAGPIVRASDFLPQCAKPRQATSNQMGWGLSLLLVGLFEKAVLADTLLAPVADEVYAASHKAGWVDAWIGTLAFSGQIFFDFAGYSTCAIGVALCLGFVLPDNFRYPYAAMGFTDFWRRWHISLSSWLRDYLYVPLGGNRNGAGRTYVNLALTMLIGGLWHGAAWRFVVWGGLHGIYLMVERMLRRHVRPGNWTKSWLFQTTMILLTYALVCVTWVFFRAPDFTSAFTLLKAMLIGAPDSLHLDPIKVWTVIAVSVGLLGGHRIMRDRNLDEVTLLLPWWVRSAALACLMVGLAITSGDDRAFIYFQF